MSEIHIAYPTDSPAIGFGIDQLVATLRTAGTSVVRHHSSASRAVNVRVSVSDGAEVTHPEGFAIRPAGDVITVSAPSPTGAMYGTLELAKRLRGDTELSEISLTTTEPTAGFRGIKFNLPWCPYRGGEQTAVHYDTCRDLEFWTQFLDMMARNRFNALTLWNLHPFPYLIRPESYPDACPFTDRELAEWQSFWHSLFQRAADRGIRTFLVNWNIVVSESFAAAYDADRFNDTSDCVKDYTRECVTQLINEYPQLDGLGVSLCDWMDELSPAEKQDWFLDTFVAGIRQAERPVTLLDRSVRTEAPAEMRRGIETARQTQNVADVLVPTKFNYSHGHSTTSLELTHDSTSGAVPDGLREGTDEPARRVWTIRNEDFFILRWGDPEFVREHIRNNLLDRDGIGGYLIGSEAFIPAVDYSHRHHRHHTWQYAFEKQWLFYLIWGRLLYDNETPDAVFEHAFAERYSDAVAEQLLEAYTAASRMPEALASFHAGTWDYSLYAEGFLASSESFGLDEGESAFISVDELIHHEPLDSDFVSIPASVAGTDAGVTPDALADRVESGGKRALAIADELRAQLSPGDGALSCELDDIAAWGHLSRYFAAKLRGGVALHRYRVSGADHVQDRAIEHLRTARDRWDSVIAVTERHYQEVPYATDRQPGSTFSWAQYREQVERDIRIAREAEPGEHPVDPAEMIQDG